MRRRILIIIMVATSVLSFAQGNFSDKYSASTQLFLSEQRGEVQLPKINVKEPMNLTPIMGSPLNLLNEPNIKKFRTRTIAEPEVVNDVKMISAFIAVNDNNFTNVEALGITIESRFKDLVVALIPVDKIEDVAKLDNVTRIEVAEILQPLNDQQRIVTQAGDAITNSAAAQALGLTKQYTGKNVILGIIDRGVDFKHIAFRDKNGKNRIVMAYKLKNNSSSLNTYSSTTEINGLTYDTNVEDHGTHTSTTAGGSSVIVDGNNVTVTDDHANATYGGMAPEADLVIAGLSNLYTTSITTAIQNICNYADQVGKPCVISLSLGSQQGPHDGTGSVANVINQYAGNNHIIVYAASNDAGKVDENRISQGMSKGGGIYAGGTSSNSKPWMAILQSSHYSNGDDNVLLLSPSILAYNRTPNQSITVKFHVIDTNTNTIVWSSDAFTNSGSISTISTLTNYYDYSSSINISIGKDYYNQKYYAQITCPEMTSKSYSKNDYDIYNSQYAFAVSVYPSSKSTTIIDAWTYSHDSWFGNLGRTISGYNLIAGSDEGSASDNSFYPNIISVGAYVTKNQITNYTGTSYDWSDYYPIIGEHASFSSYNVAGVGPTGISLPHINAPGARIVAGVNHYHTASVDDYSYYGDYFKNDLVVNSTNYPYAAMQGTSMATPCVSGIIAQWLQACVEAGKTPTPDYIKEVMAATWDTDQWTDGTGNGAHGAKTFGTHGKINAIKGIQYILGVTAEPTIIADPETLTFETIIGNTETKTFEILGDNLTGNVTATVTEGSNVFSVSPSSVSASAAKEGTTFLVTFTPTTIGTFTGTITLASEDAESIIIQLTGTAIEPELIADPTVLTFDEIEAGQTTTKTFEVLGANLVGNITATVTEGSDVFSIDPTTITSTDATDGKTVTVTFAPQTQGTYTGTVTLSSDRAETITVQLNATATKAMPQYFDVTISSVGLTTLYLDFPVAIPYETYRDLLGVYYIIGLRGNELRAARLNSNIPANTGVIVQGNSGTYRFPKISNPTPLKYSSILSGSVENVTPAEALEAAHSTGTIYTLGRGKDSYINFYKYSGNTLSAYKAFLIIEENNAKSFTMTFEDGTTGIIALDTTDNQDDAWYTVEGIKLKGKPMRKGVYLHNGKSIIIK